ncbi:hypothetical protein Y032_0002g1126 [Ancylostoma ceylanicum]|uniref:Peptidase A2 domain-containing protein n=1 Tax=Ancylostoma ceylanicum TaxID=53326 RepID=A0A016VZT4_9BILA|nr:hypothetical protein Y032_0002g1126 [Ancylostoma ceylanicum]
MALLEKEIAAKANVANGSLQKNNGEVMQSKQQHANYRHNYGKGCIFCHKGNHSPIQCRTVSNQHMRRKTLKEQNRCWKCFSPNHNSFVCRKQDCSSCGQKHHSSLCLKKELLQANYGKERRAITMALNRPNLRDWRKERTNKDTDQRTNNIQRSRTKPSSLAIQMCTETVSDFNRCPFKTTNRQIVLMTAEGSIWNAKRQQFEKVLFCFDSGAQKTVIEEKLAEQFGLAKKLINSAVAMGISDINFDNFDNVAVRIFQELAYESQLNHLAMNACRDMSASSQKIRDDDVECWQKWLYCWQAWLPLDPRLLWRPRRRGFTVQGIQKRVAALHVKTIPQVMWDYVEHMRSSGAKPTLV